MKAGEFLCGIVANLRFSIIPRRKRGGGAPYNGGFDMRCLYREKKYICGDYLEVDIYPVYKYQRSRSKKAKPTSEVQKKLNQRNAERKLIRLLNTNFTKHDIRFDLTYDADHYPSSPEEAQKECQNFLRRVKYARKKRGLPHSLGQTSKYGNVYFHCAIS